MYSYSTYDIYICHSGIYSENYRKLIKLFNSGKGFCYRCHSDEAALPSMKKARGNFTEMYKKCSGTSTHRTALSCCWTKAL